MPAYAKASGRGAAQASNAGEFVSRLRRMLAAKQAVDDRQQAIDRRLASARKLLGSLS